MQQPSSPSAPQGGSATSAPRYYRRVFALIATAIVGYCLVRIVQPFSTAILWASMLAFILTPLQKWLEWRWKRPGLSAGLLTVMMFFVVLGPVSIFGFAFTQQTNELITRMRSEAKNRNLPALQLVLEFGPVDAVMKRVGHYTELSEAEILKQASDAMREAANVLTSLGSSVVIGAFEVVVQFFMTLFLLFFLLRDGRSMVERCVRLVPLSATKKGELQKTLGGVAHAVFIGALATSLVQGGLLGIGFAIAGLPTPLVFASIGAVASLVPVVGTALVWVPAVITLIAQENMQWAIFLALWCSTLVVGSDNIIRPLIISGRSKASTPLVLLGLLGGIATFGFAGIFVGPLILTLVAALLKFADEGAAGAGLTK